MTITVSSVGLVGIEMPAQLEIEVEPQAGMRLRDLVFDHLAACDPRLPAALVDDRGQLKPGYAILVDGRNAIQIGGLDLVVPDGAAILITAMVSGG
jgi:hypothetical protein